MNKGDILFIEGKQWYSKIIQYVTRSIFSHCAIYIGNGLVLESDIGGVQINSLGRYDPYYYQIYRHKTANKEQIEKAIYWMISQTHAGYDYLGIFGILVSLVKKSEENAWDDKSKYWCTEIIADGFLSYNIPLEVDSNTWTIFPGRFSLDSNLYNVGEHDVYI